MSQTTLALQTSSHWQAGMATGAVVLGGTLTVSLPQWVWSGYPRTDVRLVPALTSDGVIYTLPAATALPVLAGHTEALFSPGRLTLRPQVTMVVGDDTPVPVRGYTATGAIRQGEMRFRVRQILACHDHERARRGLGWRVLSDTAELSGGLPVPLVRLVNAQFLQVAGNDYPLTPQGQGASQPSVVMDCRMPLSAPVPAGQVAVHGEGLAGVVLSLLEEVTLTFRDSAVPVVRWQAGLTPEVRYL
ncbi:F4 family fimbrial subunit [Citrobacter portucalensis]|uniref:F4 family fimbrial subunit n=1 Tax=Citrobacter portucalensis TaxID=1639133 RepID=UPI00288AE09D|nr:hypothetical protein [Citrobacter portucalensis]WNI84215.1 hypothetical protein RIK60_00985 [Citrobacter portucalensis]